MASTVLRSARRLANNPAGFSWKWMLERSAKPMVILRKPLCTGNSSVLPKKYREVHERTVGDTIEVDASYKTVGENYLAVEDPHGACPVCSRNLRITYKDVLILSQFIDEEGNLLPRKMTGVCAKQQLVLEECVERALAADLLPDHRPKHLGKPQVKEKGKSAFHRF